MKIAELFEKDPRREIKPVIKADERSPADLGYELDEYVVTEEISRYLREVLSQFIDSRPGRRPEKVCFWVSGWFGSGKSHFLKFLGAILSDPPLKLPSGAEVGATKYLCQKWSIPFEAHLRELRTRVVPVNLLGYVSGSTPGLSEIVYRGLMADSGYASTPWIAETEQFLARRGLYEAFRQQVEAVSGRPWAEVRNQPGPALDFMADALAEVDPAVTSRAQAERQLERQRDDLRLDPNWLVPRLADFAKELDPEVGRLAVLLDEVGLYLGNHQDRYLELKAIAENVSKADVFGKLWLVVTSQEAPEVKVPEIEARREELGWLQDRFELGLTLTPENIETVVRERLLKKTSAGEEEVARAAEENAGALSLGATLSARRNKEIFQPPSAYDLAGTYPLLPYQVRLTTEILGKLRSRGGGSEGLTGRERAILEVAQLAICDSELLEKQVGPLITFEGLYDAVASGTASVPTSHQAEVRELPRAAPDNGAPVQTVAKALYLLQQVPEWVPANAQNLSVVLYPALGARPEDVASGVRAGLAELEQSHQVGEKDGAFRFLDPVERTFEQDVARAMRNLSAPQRKKLRGDLLGELLREWKTLRYRSGAGVFDVKVEADGDVLNPKGYLRLVARSPLATEATDFAEVERRDSLQDVGAVWWVTDPSADLANMADRALAMEAVLSRAEASGPDAARFRAERSRELDTLRHSTLPGALRDALSHGTLVAKGASRKPEPREWEQEVRAALEERAEEVFYEFSAAAASVRDDDTGKVLSWHGGALPECYRALGVVVDGSIREDSPLLSKILEELKRREASHEPSRGADLSEHFERPPYGWDDRVVRLGLACLLRNGSVEVQTSAGTLRSASDPSAARALTNRPTFKDASFRPAQVLSDDQRRAAGELVAKWFDEVRDTPEEIDEALRSGLRRAREKALRLAQRLRDFQLGGAKVLEKLGESGAEVLDLATPTTRLLAVLEPSINSELGDGLALLRSLSPWERADGFGQASAVQQFLVAASGSVADQVLGRLKSLLAEEDLPSAWPALQETYQAALATYANAYLSAHKQLRDRVSAAVQQLEQEPGIGDCKVELSNLQKLSCPVEEPDVRTAPFRCASCHRSIAELERDVGRANEARAQILRKLQARVFTPTEGKQLGPFEKQAKVSSPEEVEPLTAALEAYVGEALRSGRIEVRLTARPIEEGDR